MNDASGHRVPLTLEQAMRAVKPPPFTADEWAAMRKANAQYHARSRMEQHETDRWQCRAYVPQTYDGGSQRRATELHPEGVPE
jgi:hypothetical protein